MHKLLLVDDDPTFCEVLSQALDRRGYAVYVAHNAAEGLAAASRCRPGYAVVDLRMPRGSGLELVAGLSALDHRLKIVVLTGYASIATAVEAIKLGATHYLAKPADADEIIAAFGREQGDARTPLVETPMSVERLAWELIHRVLMECHGNISAAARCLGRKYPAR